MVGKTLKHYHVEELLGKGGMGEVYRALDTKLKRPVAIKILREELTSDEERRKRFLQEARAAAAVVHPAIAQVYDVDEVDDLTFIVMEFVEGETVSQLIVKKELDLLGSIEIALQVSEGLSQAHKSNIIHRDIKSDNIMVTRTGHAKVLDFGLAKLLETKEAGATPESTLDFHRTATMAKTIAGTVMGTIAYMSPEQARGQDIAQPSDVFSLGIVLYEMVTGELPFTGESPLDTMHSIAFEEAKPVTVIRRNLPPHLHRIIAKCLRKKAEDRYPDAHTLALDLKQLKHEIDSGIQRPLAPLDHVQNIMDWAKSSITSSTQLIVLAIFVIAAVTLIFVFAIPWAQLLWIGIVGFFVYRYIRNRKNRMIKKFAGQVSKIKETLAIIRKENLITVAVEKAQAKIYIRVNDLVDEINRKLYIGKHIEVAVRDDIPPEEFQRILREPGVLYVRDDVILEKPQNDSA